jgi:hypothetical protein
MYLADCGNGAGAAAVDWVDGAADGSVDEPLEQADRVPSAKSARTPMIKVQLGAEDLPGRFRLGQQVVVARQRHQPGIGDDRRQFLAVAQRHAMIVTRVHDQGRAGHAFGHVANVDARELLQEPDRILGRGGPPLQVVELLPVGAGAVGQELRREYLAEGGVVTAPADPGEIEIECGGSPFLVVHGPDRSSPGIGRAQDELGDPLRVPGGVGHCDGTALGHAQQRKPFEPKGFDHGLEIRDPGIEREVPGLPIREPAALVVANELVSQGQVAHPVSPHRALDVVPEMRHPVRRADQGWSLPGDRVCQAHPVGRATERDVLTRRWRGFGCDGDGGRIDDDGADELVTATAHGTDIALKLAVVTERAAGRLDAAGQRRLTDEATTPDGVEQLLLGHEAVVVADQLRHDVEHLRLDADHVTAATQFVAGRVEHEVVETPRPTRRHRLGGWVRGRHGHSVPIWFERCWWSLMVIVAVNRLQDVNAFAAGFIHRR